MKGLILSFFAVLLAYSLFFDDNEGQTAQPVLNGTNSVYTIQPTSIWVGDTLQNYKKYTTYTYTDILESQHIL